MQTVFVRLYGIMNAGVMMKQRFEEYLGDIRSSPGSEIAEGGNGHFQPFSTRCPQSSRVPVPQNPSAQ